MFVYGLLLCSNLSARVAATWTTQTTSARIWRISERAAHTSGSLIPLIRTPAYSELYTGIWALNEEKYIAIDSGTTPCILARPDHVAYAQGF